MVLLEAGSFGDFDHETKHTVELIVAPANDPWENAHRKKGMWMTNFIERRKHLPANLVPMFGIHFFAGWIFWQA